MGLTGINHGQTLTNPESPIIKRAMEEHPWNQSGLSRVERVVLFLESLPVTSGNLRGEDFKLRPWQRTIIEAIYAVDDKGIRYVREAILSFPRKNGKTGLAAGLALCHICGPEAIQRGQVYSAAAARKQAALIFNEIAAIANKVKWMRDRLIIRQFTKNIEDIVTNTVYEALAAEVPTQHGLSTSFWIYDELAQAKDRRLYDVLATSTGAWEEPLGIVISTQSPDPRHIMSELVDDGLKIAEGQIQDRSRYACIYTAPMDADPWAEKTWFDCNPALNDFRSLDEMHDFAKKAKRIPTMEDAFRLLYLNQRVREDAGFVARADWDACGKDFDPRMLKGRLCYAALDLSGSGKNDLTAMALLFPFEEGPKYVRGFFWACEEGLDQAESRDRVPYRLWAKQGHLKTVPGRVLDYETIARQFAELTQIYDVKLLAYDPYKFLTFAEACNKVGVDVEATKHAQSFKEMDASIQALEDDILSWNLVHDNNPILTWNMDNVKIEIDSAGNRKFSKRKSTGRIDGAVALAMACGLAKASKPKEAEFQAFIL